ncbi:DUF58 domain-containing protein [Vibrio hippocampi]|uniref:DUF58 domain-containing protein n=1 Tax=Vibrio hippocampi TaxID=654686 RepID=A0ABN8DNP1_9VIBR|nr:DUF58 domain-containing protein [Vibrio hippocampi]CAH0529016.1 hypothetical protein VHP8226_03008 [Vibrio hippocampi]
MLSSLKSLLPSSPSTPPLAVATKEGLLPELTNGVEVTVDELAFYQIHSQRWQPPKKSVWSQLNGQHASPKKGRGMTFSEVRQYQAGDDVRQIDWRVTARTGKVHTKLFTEERERPVVLFIDLSSSLFSGTTLLLKSVQLCHLASLLSWVALSTQDRVGAVIRYQDQLIEIRPSSSRCAILHLLQQLCQIHNQHIQQSDITTRSHTTSDSALSALVNLCKKGSELIILSDFSTITDDELTAVTHLSKHNRVRAVMLYDPIEVGESPAKGQQSVQGKRHEIQLDLSNKQTRNDIKHSFEQRFAYIAQSLLPYGIALSKISSGQPLLLQLLSDQQ